MYVNREVKEEKPKFDPRPAAPCYDDLEFVVALLTASRQKLPSTISVIWYSRTAEVEELLKTPNTGKNLLPRLKTCAGFRGLSLGMRTETGHRQASLNGNRITG